ncbi:ccdc77 [Scenedesmus sp. PABB004]|nr:ccdc77 [Scenedesmus sp. PABB004]
MLPLLRSLLRAAMLGPGAPHPRPWPACMSRRRAHAMGAAAAGGRRRRRGSAGDGPALAAAVASQQQGGALPPAPEAPPGPGPRRRRRSHGSDSSSGGDDSGSDSGGGGGSISDAWREQAAVAAAAARLSRFLDFRERAASEVSAKLAALGYDRQLAARVLASLQDAGLQSDARFAEMFVRSYWRSKAQSPARLAYELRARQVAQPHIDAALAAVFGEARQLPAREASSEQEEEAWVHLVEVCRQRAEHTRGEPAQKRRAKLAAWLQRRGHGMSTIFRVFAELSASRSARRPVRRLPGQLAAPSGYRPGPGAGRLRPAARARGRGGAAMDEAAPAPAVRPVEEVLPSPQLLEHYRSRIDEFERERSDLLSAVERCAVQHDEVHRLEWENRKRADEIRELQKALSDAQQFLFEERQRLLALTAENDELKLQEVQDRQRIQALLSMTQPLEQAITFPPGGGPPTAVTALPRAGGGKARAGERVLRTVFLPAADPEFLVMKVESLQAQLDEQRQLHEERVAALLNDRQLRAQEEERQHANMAVQVEALARQVTQLEETLRTTTREYILARREKQEAQAAAAAAAAQMAAEVGAARGELAAARRAARAQVERAASSADGKMREYVERFREQVRSRDEELLTLGSVHASSKEAAERRIAELEGRVGRLLEANRQLELRRQLDADGWAADVTRLRQSLAVVDRKLLQMRLIDRLDDDERLDALLDQLERKTPGLKPQQPQQPPAGGGARARSAGARPGRPRARRAAGAGAAARRGGRAAPAGRRPRGTSRRGPVKSGLAAELRAVRQQLEELEERADAKARRALVGLPGGSNSGGGRATGLRRLLPA